MENREDYLTLAAVGLAEGLVDEEIIKHPGQLSQKESILAAKTEQYKNELKQFQETIEGELQQAGILVQQWFTHLPANKKVEFEKELQQAQKVFKSREFNNIFLDEVFNSENATLQKLLNLSPSLLQSLSDEAKKYQEEGNYENSILLNKLLLYFNPLVVERYHQIGYCYFLLKKMDAAFTYFDLARVLAPEDPKGYYLLALCQSEQQEFKKAQEIAQKGLNLSTPYPEWMTLFENLLKTMKK